MRNNPTSIPLLCCIYNNARPGYLFYLEAERSASPRLGRFPFTHLQQSMALRLARLMEAASVKEAIRATPRNAKSPAAAGILVSSRGGGWPTKQRTRQMPVQQFIPAATGSQCALLSFFLVHPRLGCQLGTRLNRTTIDRPTDTRVERHFNERAAAL